jgi:hypothetical protein
MIPLSLKLNHIELISHSKFGFLRLVQHIIISMFPKMMNESEEKSREWQIPIESVSSGILFEYEVHQQSRTKGRPCQPTIQAILFPLLN